MKLIFTITITIISLTLLSGCGEESSNNELSPTDNQDSIDSGYPTDGGHSNVPHLTISGESLVPTYSEHTNEVPSVPTH